MLENENKIVWLEPVENLDYVREKSIMTSFRHGMISKHDRPNGRVVGYSELLPGTPGISKGTFRRRVFWLAPHDRDSAGGGPYQHSAPGEAVDPRTVAPNVAGALTDRAWGDTIELFHDGEVIESSPQKFRQLALL